MCPGDPTSASVLAAMGSLKIKVQGLSQGHVNYAFMLYFLK